MELFAASLVARKAGRAAARGRLRRATTSPSGRRRCPTAPIRSSGAAERAIDDHRATLGPHAASTSTPGSPNARWSPSGAIGRTLGDLQASGVVYEGDGATWLRATDNYDDDKDRVLVRSNGEFTYLLPDIAYHRDKYARGFDTLIDVWGADHHGYVARLRFALQALGHPADAFTVCIIQLVQLLRDGQEVRLSKRTGEIVTVDEMLDEVGPDAARLTYLLQSVDSRQAFDLTAGRRPEEREPGLLRPVRQRPHPLPRPGGRRGRHRAAPARRGRPGPAGRTSGSWTCCAALAELPEVVELAARELAPHKVTTWVRELAGAFHGFYHDCRVMGEGVDAEHHPGPAVAGRSVPHRPGRSALDLLGVSAPETM